MIKLSKLLVSGLVLFGCCHLWASDFVIIANPSVPITKLTQDDLSDIYLLRTMIWEDGTRIIPVNREISSNTRAAFSARILRQRQEALSNYWDKMRYKGLTPPLIQESDQAVLAFVQKIPGAIGYVKDSATLRNIKILKLQDETE